ncbi:hypothetical protein NDU88_004607 [Pleurodeles waltl]|uniref:Uncharacterized protein n=1 Tax=Pleurodeles waltl TaxID=8319 RepID=A0AAV7L1X4_PLEWA|nr:hypothetical protein NDU88_004607 [Pleurodeles waltl]
MAPSGYHETLRLSPNTLYWAIQGTTKVPTRSPTEYHGALHLTPDESAPGICTYDTEGARRDLDKPPRIAPPAPALVLQRAPSDLYMATHHRHLKTTHRAPRCPELVMSATFAGYHGTTHMVPRCPAPT